MVSSAGQMSSGLSEIFGDRLKVTARCHNVTTLTTDPNFRKVVVVILWFGSKGSDQFLFCSQGSKQKKLHQVHTNKHSLRNSLNSLQEDGCLVVISGAAHRERSASPRPTKVRRVMPIYSHTSTSTGEKSVLGKRLRYREGSRKNSGNSRLHFWPEMTLILLHCRLLSLRILYTKETATQI